MPSGGKVELLPGAPDVASGPAPTPAQVAGELWSYHVPVLPSRLDDRYVTLLASGGDFDVATEACLGQNQAATTIDDASSLSTGEGAWYLLRAISGGGDGSYDSGGAQQSGQRDAEVAASGAACP